MTEDPRVLTLAERLSQLGRIFRRRWFIFVGLPLIAAFVAAGVSTVGAARYEATSKLLLSNTDLVGAPTTATSSGNVDPERDLNTKVGLIRLEKVAEDVQTRLHLRMPLDELVKDVTATPEGTTNIVDVTATAASPEQAVAIANAFATQYIAFRTRVARVALDQAAADLRRQLASLPPAERSTSDGVALRTRLREVEVSSAVQTGGAQLVLSAMRPTSSVSPHPTGSAVIGGLLGAMLAILVVLLLELTDRRVRDPTEVQAVSDVPVLAHIRRARWSMRSAEARDGYESVAGQILLAGRRNETTSLMVSSPGPGDRDTSVTLGLAAALAEVGRQVIVIETDPDRSSLGSVPPSDHASGLAAVAADAADLGDELVELDVGSGPGASGGVTRDSPGWPVSSVWLLPHGRGHGPVLARATLPSFGVANVVRDARDMADVVLIDAGSSVALQSSLLVDGAVDAVLVVCRLGYTMRDALAGALRTPAQAGVAVLGQVIVEGAGGTWARRAGRAAAKATDHRMEPDLVPASERRGE